MLNRVRVDVVRRQRRAVPTLPDDRPSILKAQQQIELLSEELLVVLEVVTEQREALGEAAPAGDYLGAAAGDQIQLRELLPDADRILGGEHGDGRGKSDPLGLRRHRS
uniref:Unannotated protein n=1 Tax=freshwater metagenome TaxID=449393 RepID=A0A6J5ZZW8_9ZZZZ